MRSRRRPRFRMLVAATAGTLAVAPLLAPRASHSPAPSALSAVRPQQVPAPPTWPLLATGLAALGGAVVVRRRA